MKARAEEKSKVDAGVWIGDVTTINLTIIEVLFLNVYLLYTMHTSIL